MMDQTGKVWLVGAGPGDPDLITRKGLRLLQSADVIVFDRLAPPELLDEARPDAVLINVGKAPARQRQSQEHINEVLISRARGGAQIVRLKGGDPLLFGRGGEEALACHAAGIPFEIVPGVSSACAAPAYAGIPLTQREISSSVTIITGHDLLEEGPARIDYDALSQIGGTLVILMGVKSLPRLQRRLLEAGLNPQTPAAAIEWGSVAGQRVIEAPLTRLADTAVARALRAPAIIVIGEVVRLRRAGMRWFDLPTQVEEQMGESNALQAILEGT